MELKKLSIVGNPFKLLCLLSFLLSAQFGFSQTTTKSFTSTGTFIVPAGVTSVKAEAWGAGGAGGGSNSGKTGGGSGGAGGAYAAKISISVTAKTSYDIIVGTGGIGASKANGGAGGDSYFSDGTEVKAQGGAGGLAANGNVAGGAGSIASSIGDTKYVGGNGAGGTSTIAGGGGGGAGSTGAGGNASTTTGGSGKLTGGGNGASSAAADNVGNSGTAAGGGGSGTYSNKNASLAGGSGADGRVDLTWSCNLNVSNFSTSASKTSPNGSSIISISSSTLANGTYTVYYTLSGANTASISEATMIFSGGTGTFSTANMANLGSTTISIYSLGCALTESNNTATFEVSAKEYRSNVNSYGLWNNKNSWQESFNGIDWVSASDYPKASNETLLSTSSGYPVILGTSSQSIADNTNHLITFPTPAGSSSGDLIMILWADHSNGPTTVSTPVGWTQQSLGGFHDGAHGAILFYKQLASGDGNNVRFTTPSAEASTQIVYRIKAGTFGSVVYQNFTSLTNSTIDPPALNIQTAGKYLIFAAGFSHPYSPSVPTNYNSPLDNPAESENAEVYATYRQMDLSAGSSENPGNFGSTTMRETSASATIGIKGIDVSSLSGSGKVTVRNGHTIAISDNATADEVLVESTGLLKIDKSIEGKSTLSLDIWSGSLMTVNGTVDAPNDTYISGKGSFTLASGATFKVGSEYGLTTGSSTAVTAGNVRVTGTRTYNSTANYYFNHAGAQVTGNAITTANNVNIEGGGVKELSTNLSVSGELTLTSGHIRSTTGNLLELTNTGSVADASSSSFVWGSMKKTGFTSATDYTFNFPVGLRQSSDFYYNPITVKVTNGLSTDSYIVGYNHGRSSFGQIRKKADNNNELGDIPNRATWSIQQISGADNPLDLTIYSGPGYNADLGKFSSTLSLDTIFARSFSNGWGRAISSKAQLATIESTESMTATGIYLGASSTSKNQEINYSGLASSMNNIVAQNESNSILTTSEVIFGPAIPSEKAQQLPVQLINFTARATPEKKVALNWTTATESVNKGFRIERQTVDLGNKFENIGFVNSKAFGGNSQSNLYYNFLDNNPKPSAANHYRLVQEDLDGTLTHSEVRMVRLGKQSVSMVFPNPSAGNVTISRTDDGKKMNIQIIDLSGKVVKEYNNISESYYKFNITQPGVYNIKMTYPETGEQSVQRVVVQR